MEQLDYYDGQLNLLGAASREEVHQKGYWHKTFHCWLIQEEAGKEYVFWQKRSPEKDTFPDFYDITAAGHIQKGEDLEAGARELSEELGIAFLFSDLFFLGVNKVDGSIGTLINREFCYTYFLEMKGDWDDFHLQEEEVEALVRVELNQGLDLLYDRIEKLKVEGIRQIKGAVHRQEFTMKKENLLPHGRDYYLRIFYLAAQYLRGERDLQL